MAEAASPKKKIEEVPEKLHVWPYLVRLEFLCALVVIIGDNASYGIIVINKFINN